MPKHIMQSNEFETKQTNLRKQTRCINSKTDIYIYIYMRNLPVETDSGTNAMMVLLSPDAPGPFLESPADVVAVIPDYLTGPVSRPSPGVVPHWSLAREGPFLAERSPSSILCLDAGCAFRNTTYRPWDHAPPSGDFGIPLHHPRLLEWLKLPESASLLEMGPGRWLYLLF